MKVVVCMKQTFDTEERLSFENGEILEADVKWIMNPYDEYAVEEALRVREKHGGEVTVISVGPQRCESALRTALAMGADHAILVHDEACYNGDEHTIAYTLAAVIAPLSPDLVLCGYMSIDNGAGQGGLRLAEMLQLPHISAVTKLTIDGEMVEAERDCEGDIEIVESKLPILITTQQGLNEPRYPPLPGIMKAKKKPLKQMTAEDVTLDSQALQAKTLKQHQFPAPKRQAGRRLDGTPQAQAQALVKLLAEEAKVL